jgi:hypothetical protein
VGDHIRHPVPRAIHARGADCDFGGAGVEALSTTAWLGGQFLGLVSFGPNEITTVRIADRIYVERYVVDSTPSTCG